MGGISIRIDRELLNIASIGYWIAVPYWNKGYMTEALKQIIAFGF